VLPNGVRLSCGALKSNYFISLCVLQTLSLVPYLSARCDKVLAAADFSAAVELGSRRTSEAFDAAFALVSSFAALY
jgi:hypothetical protein